MHRPALKTFLHEKTSQKVTIDGKIDELAWKDAARFDEMVEFRPVMGRKEEFGNHTEAYLMYDDEGIYFGGICHERNVDSVSRSSPAGMVSAPTTTSGLF
ncbi:MAG: hypothetical protein IPH28_07615 [Cytophagaceae bacterium]|nr:hypothetical protein [Cytophagaceae bacterium]